MGIMDVPNFEEQSRNYEHFKTVLNSSSPTWKELIDMLAVIQAQNQVNSDFIAMYLAENNNVEKDYDKLLKNYSEKMDIAISGYIKLFTEKFSAELENRITK
jgi:hypothetical protein